MAFEAAYQHTVAAYSRAEDPKLWGAPPGALLTLRRAEVLYMRGIYFERYVGATQNIYFGR
jgi:hypothetical protein